MDFNSTVNSTDDESHVNEDLNELPDSEKKSDISFKRQENSVILENKEADVKKEEKEDVKEDEKDMVSSSNKNNETDDKAENVDEAEINLMSIDSKNDEVEESVDGNKEEMKDVKNIPNAKHVTDASVEEIKNVVPVSDEPNKISGESKIREQKQFIVEPISTRLDYLSRPKKDILDNFERNRLDGALPESAYPSWPTIALPTKIPYGDCEIPITKRKLGTNLFLPPPANDFDLADDNNLRLPSATYEKMHDPNLKEYFENESMMQHLCKEGFITKDGKTICPLSDINRYRVYQRRILAAEVQKKCRDQDEEIRKERARGMEEKIKQDMLRYHERRTQESMRRWIKNTITSIKDSSMANQVKKDRKTINCRIRRQKAQEKRVDAVQERYQKIFNKHMREKYEDNKTEKKKTQLAYFKDDLKRVQKLCEIQEQTKLDRKEKLDEFWKRKFNWQIEWLKQGEELERMRKEERERNIETLKETGTLPLLFLREKGKDKTSVSTTKDKRSPRKKELDLDATKREILGETVPHDEESKVIMSSSQEIRIEEKNNKLEATSGEETTESEADTDKNTTESYNSERNDLMSHSSVILSENANDYKPEPDIESDSKKHETEIEDTAIDFPSISSKHKEEEIETSESVQKEEPETSSSILEDKEPEDDTESETKSEPDIDEVQVETHMKRINNNLNEDSLISSKEDETDNATESMTEGKTSQSESDVDAD